MASAAKVIQTDELNRQQRAAIAARAYEYKNVIFSQEFSGGAADLGRVISAPVRNTGLIKKFLVEVEATVSGASGAVQTRQALANGNIFSRVQFWDFSNKERINTTGWHLAVLAASKRGRALASAYTSDTPNGIGANANNVEYAPSSINATASTPNVFHTLEIPVCRDDYDLRGIVNANVTNASARVELTINPQFFAGSSDNGVLSVYKSGSSTKGTLDKIKITIYQIGYDQAIDNAGNQIVPILDSSVAYMLSNTSENALSVNQTTQISFANNRTFLSLTMLYDNGGTLNAGTDISKFGHQSANFTRWQEYGARHAMFLNRERFGGDLPLGMYHFSYLDKPINVTQAGNITLEVTPTTVNSGARLLMGWESFAALVAIPQAVTIGA